MHGCRCGAAAAAAAAAARHFAIGSTAPSYQCHLYRTCSPQLRYANNSNYKNDTMIRKECYVSQAVLDELRRIIEDAEARLFPPLFGCVCPLR